ncbi:MAG: hypothetical protein AAB632_02580 [Patescibacteria group bacterium]
MTSEKTEEDYKNPGDVLANESQDLSKNPKIEIIKGDFMGDTKELEEATKKYDVPGMVSEATGLDWKTSILKLKHIEKSADWEDDDTVLINLGTGAYALSGVSHECLHLILRQNNWLESSKISAFIKKYPEMRIDYPEYKAGYPIEQLIAYLIQDEISKKIGQEEEIGKLITTGGHGPFEVILDREYDTNTKKKLGKMIIEKWPDKKKYPDIIKWIENIIENFEEGS